LPDFSFALVVGCFPFPTGAKGSTSTGRGGDVVTVGAGAGASLGVGSGSNEGCDRSVGDARTSSDANGSSKSVNAACRAEDVEGDRCGFTEVGWGTGDDRGMAAVGELSGPLLPLPAPDAGAFTPFSSFKASTGRPGDVTEAITAFRRGIATSTVELDDGAKLTSSFNMALPLSRLEDDLRLISCRTRLRVYFCCDKMPRA
jgi:hypothetical protein